MKILHIIASIDPKSGGPIEGILASTPRLRELGHERFIASLDSPLDPWLQGYPLPVFALGTRSASAQRRWRWLPWVYFRYSSRIVPWLRRHIGEYDVVVVNGIWNYAALAALRALRGSNVPYFVFTHGMLDPWFRRTYPLKHLLKQVLWWFSEGPLLSGARAVIFTSDEERLLARNAFWPYRIKEKVVGYGTTYSERDPQKQTSAFLDSFPVLKGRKFLLFISRIHPKKGCDLLIRAFAEVAGRYPDLDVVMAGPDQTNWGPELKSLARGLGVQDRVHWPGMLAGDQKWGAFHGCEALILPSHQENFGIVVAEALACGKPVLISNKVNIWREIRDDNAGMVADDDFAGTLSLLQRFLALPAAAQSAMKHAARMSFVKRFDMSNNIKQFVSILQTGLAK